jgi:putative membrane protein
MPMRLTSDLQSKYDQLSKLDGAEFDRAYMKQTVEDHDRDVGDFQKEAKEGKDSQLKSFANQTLPTIKQHDHMAKRERRTL